MRRKITAENFFKWAQYNRNYCGDHGVVARYMKLVASNMGRTY